MKICPLCQATYSDRIDFCFEDGEVLVGAPRVESGVLHDELLDPPSSEVPITGEVPIGTPRPRGRTITRAPMPTLVPTDVAALGFGEAARPREEDLDVPVPTRFHATRTATPAPVAARPAVQEPMVAPPAANEPMAAPPTANEPVAGPPAAQEPIPEPVPPGDDSDDDLAAFTASASPASAPAKPPVSSGSARWWLMGLAVAAVALLVAASAAAVMVWKWKAADAPANTLAITPPVDAPPAAEKAEDPAPPSAAEALTELAEPQEDEPAADAGTASVEPAPVVPVAPPPAPPPAPPTAAKPPPVPTAIAPTPPPRTAAAPRAEVPRTEPKPSAKPTPAPAASTDDNPWGTVEAAPVKKGKVVVLMAGQTQGHELLVDGQRKGKLPVTLELPEGTHLFAVEKADGGRMQVTRDVKFDGSKPVFINL
jgi:hypothetical protein